MIAKLQTIFDQLMHQPGEAFKAILPFVLVATVAFILLHLVVSLLGGRAKLTRRRWGWFASLVYVTTVVSVATLGATSFYAVLRFGALEGWWMFAHVWRGRVHIRAASTGDHLGYGQSFWPPCRARR